MVKKEPTSYSTETARKLMIASIHEKRASDPINVEHDTPFTLEAGDTGSGVNSTSYRMFNATYGDGWKNYTTQFTLNSMADATYTIEYDSIDNQKNVEATDTVSV
jgi:hypothetical protein